MNKKKIQGPFRMFFTDSGVISGRFSHRYRWVEDSYVVDKGGDSIEQISYTTSSLKKKTIVWFFIGFLFCFTVVFLRLGQIQLLQGENYAGLAERNRQRVLPILAERGLIYDRNNIQLTQNIPNFSLALTPQDLPRDSVQRAEIVNSLAQITGDDIEQIAALIEQYGNYSYESIVLKENLEYETALQLHMQASGLPGIGIIRGSKRLYLHNTQNVANEIATSSKEIISLATSTVELSLSHILGYQGKLSPEELDAYYPLGYLPSDNIGKIGIEKQYETELRGTYGKSRIEVDSRGKEQTTLAEEAPIPGKHLVLTIDADMQQALAQIMQSQMDQAGNTRGSAIVTNPQNGEILAMVSIPSFDNNDFSGGISSEAYQSYIENIDNPLFNRSIAGTYPSGSTIKPIVAAAALQEGIITSATTFLSSGGIRVGQWFFPDWKAGGHGRTDVRYSLADSINTFYYIIGGGYKDQVGLGVDLIAKYFYEFGFSQKLGIDLPGERAGFIPSKEWKEEKKGERWYVGDTYNLSIGQGDLLVTPLQIAMMTGAIANGGTIYSPRIAQKTVDPLTREEILIPSQVFAEHIVESQHIETIRWGMRDCVTIGSCRRLSTLPFSSAGKTGTAQWSSQKEPHAWFTSFAPMENPEVSITIMIEEGEGGSLIGAPIAYDFYQWWNLNRY